MRHMNTIFEIVDLVFLLKCIRKNASNTSDLGFDG